MLPDRGRGRSTGLVSTLPRSPSASGQRGYGGREMPSDCPCRDPAERNRPARLFAGPGRPRARDGTRPRCRLNALKAITAGTAAGAGGPRQDRSRSWGVRKVSGCARRHPHPASPRGPTPPRRRLRRWGRAARDHRAGRHGAALAASNSRWGRGGENHLPPPTWRRARTVKRQGACCHVTHFSASLRPAPAPPPPGPPLSRARCRRGLRSPPAAWCAARAAGRAARGRHSAEGSGCGGRRLGGSDSARPAGRRGRREPAPPGDVSGPGWGARQRAGPGRRPAVAKRGVPCAGLRAPPALCISVRLRFGVGGSCRRWRAAGRRSARRPAGGSVRPVLPIWKREGSLSRKQGLAGSLHPSDLVTRSPGPPVRINHAARWKSFFLLGEALSVFLQVFCFFFSWFSVFQFILPFVVCFLKAGI